VGACARLRRLFASICSKDRSDAGSFERGEVLLVAKVPPLREPTRSHGANAKEKASAHCGRDDRVVAASLVGLLSDEEG
jgi:hypothetical protein